MILIDKFTETPYKTLNNALENVLHFGELVKVYMDQNGECQLTFVGKLTENTLLKIKQCFLPKATAINENEYLYGDNYTEYYTPDGINLKV